MTSLLGQSHVSLLINTAKMQYISLYSGDLLNGFFFFFSHLISRIRRARPENGEWRRGVYLVVGQGYVRRCRCYVYLPLPLQIPELRIRAFPLCPELTDHLLFVNCLLQVLPGTKSQCFYLCPISECLVCRIAKIGRRQHDVLPF